ncbi:hypothetical protein PACTADRAFT_50715 [Pachysolen tannophilus NRRL Y-2460]|uniref:Exosome complex component RRP45 n=1 Tax=Pachysolen tannophilus NRRL Y-2460 TaxID=669874 RepID=A0A1E4TSY7_PACTA|nr:hypothetical protein PACTADRAFT_50715 [Pachysolen tannophilus NRRL Y-2460]
MPKGIDVSNVAKDFELESLKQGLRLDGRKLNEFRDVEINIGNSYGSVDVKLGKTRIAVRISAEIVAPFEDRPFEGLFMINTEISPMASAMFESGRQSDEEILISRLIEKAVRRSNALDLESLCIIAGEKCWSIRADIHYLDYDGNFADISCIGVLCALLHFKKPDITINEHQEIIVHPINERVPVPLSILHIPICVTFAFFNPNDVEENIKGDSNAELIVVDPTMGEELLAYGSLTLTMNKNRELVQISKAGGLSIDAMVIMDCSNLAYEIACRITDQIREAIKADDAKRAEKRLEIRL